MKRQMKYLLIVAALALLLTVALAAGSLTGAGPLDWEAADFTTDGYTITGFSPSGLAKVAHDKELYIPSISGIYAIGDRAFQTQGLTLVDLPITITEIGEYAFADNQLTSIQLPGVATIGAHAFRVNKLTEVELPSTVTYIAANAFQANDRVVRINTSAIGLPSSFTAGDGHVINPVSITVRMVDIDTGDPIGDGIKVLGTNFSSAELFPAGETVTVSAPPIYSWMAKTAPQIVIAAGGLNLTFEYEFAQFKPVITVYDKTFITGSIVIDETLIRSWITAVSGIDGSPIPQSNISVTPSSIDASSPAVHNVSYVVVDDVGNTATKTIKVTIGSDPMEAYIGDSNWQYDDFIYGTYTFPGSYSYSGVARRAVFGISNKGRAKFLGGETTITFPGFDPNTNEPIKQFSNHSGNSMLATLTGNPMELDFSQVGELEIVSAGAFNGHNASILDFSNNPKLTIINPGTGSVGCFSSSAPNRLTTVVFDNPELTMIGQSAFAGNILTSVDFSGAPKLQTIGYRAFSGGQMTSIIFNNPELTEIGNTAFLNHRVANLDLSGAPKLETIGNGAFCGTSASDVMTTIIIDNPELKTIVGPGTSTSSTDGAFRNHNAAVIDLSGAPKLESIGDNAFRGISGTNVMTSIIFDNPELKTIEDSAFFNHRAATLDFSSCEKLEEINDSAFRGAVNTDGYMTSIILDTPELKTIGANAFQYHSAPTLDFSGAKKLESIGNLAFAGIAGSGAMTSIIFDNPNLKFIYGATVGGTGGAFRNHNAAVLDFRSAEKLETIGMHAFRGDPDAGVELMTTIVFDNPVLDRIDDYAFCNHHATTLDFSKTPMLRIIGQYAFRGADSSSGYMTSIIFKNPELTNINASAFQYHSAQIIDLSSLKKLTSIGGTAFGGVSAPGVMSSIIIDNPVLTTISANAFANHRVSVLDFSGAPLLQTIGSLAFEGVNGSGATTAIVFNNPVLRSIGYGAFRYNQLTGVLDMSSCTSFQSFGFAIPFYPSTTQANHRPVFGNTALEGILIGGVPTGNSSGTLYDITTTSDWPYACLTFSDIELPVYIMNNTAGIIAARGYVINPVEVTCYFLEQGTDTPIAPYRRIMLSGPLDNYLLDAPHIFGYEAVQQNVPVNAEFAQQTVNAEAVFYYIPRDPHYYDDWAGFTITQTAPIPYGKIGSTLRTTVRLSMSSLAVFDIPAGYQVEILYDPTRIDKDSISVSAFASIYSIDTSQPGKVVLTLTRDFKPGDDVLIQLTWKLLFGPTELNTDLPIQAQVVKPDGEPMAIGNEVALSGWYSRPYISKLANGSGVNYSYIDFSYDTTPTITYSYSLNGLERNVSTVTLTDYLPVYTKVVEGVESTAVAIFDPIKNPGWTNNGDGTVSYTVTGLNTMTPPLPRLILDFPDIKQGQTVTNTISFVATPHRMVSTETTFSGRSSISNLIGSENNPERPPGYVTFSKTSQRPRFWDLPNDKALPFGWQLRVGAFYSVIDESTGLSVLEPLPDGQYYTNINLADDSLDPRMQYVSVNVGDFVGARVVAYDALGDIIFNAMDVQGTVTFPTSIRPDIVRVEILDSPVKVYGGKYLRAYITTELRDPASVSYAALAPTGEATDGTGLRFLNTGYLLDFDRYNNTDELMYHTTFTGGVTAETRIYGFDAGLGVSKAIQNKKDYYMLDGTPQSVTFKLNLDIYNGVNRLSSSSDIPNTADIISNAVIYDVIPQDIVLDATKPFVPSNELIKNTTNMQWRIIPEGFTAQDGKKYDLLQITADTLKPLQLVREGGTLGTLNGFISELAPNDHRITNRVYLDYTSDIFEKAGPKTSNDNNPCGEAGVLTGSDYLDVLATEAFSGQKEIRGKDASSQWQLWTTTGVKTQPGAEFQYRLRLRNNTTWKRSNISVVDVFPYFGDVGIADLHIPRHSQFSNTLASTSAIVVFHEGTQLTENVEYKIEYLLTPINPAIFSGYTPDHYFDNIAIWTPSNLLQTSDLVNVSAFRLTTLSGFELDLDEEFEVRITMNAPLDLSYVNQLAWNSFVRRDDRQPSYLEMPPVYNEIPDKLANITLNKFGDPSSVRLNGVTFGLYKMNGELVQIQTTAGSGSTAGRLVFTNVERADYYIQEISVPAEYQLSTTRYYVRYSDFTDPAGVNDAPLVAYGKLYTYTVPNIFNTLKPVYGSLKLHKTDANGDDFAGISFQIRQVSSPNTTYTVTTDEDGMIRLNNLLVGNWTITEQTPPGRLTQIPQFTVSVTETAITISGTTAGVTKDDTDAILINVVNNRASARLMKLGYYPAIDEESPLPGPYNSTLGSPLGGVSFTLHTATSWDDPPTSSNQVGTAQTTLTSGANLGSITFTNLIVGQIYAVKEVAAPANYQTLNDPVYFVVNERGVACDISGNNLADNTVYVMNRRMEQTGSLTVTKVDSVDPDLRLPGAVFRLEKWDDEGEEWNLVEILTTVDPSGQATKGSLEFGVYRVIEITAPVGYIKYNQPQIFVVDRFMLNQFFAYTFENTELDVRLVKGVFIQNYNLDIPAQKAAYDIAIAYLETEYGSSRVFTIPQPNGTVTVLVGLDGAIFEMKEYEGSSVDPANLLGTYELTSDAQGYLSFAPADAGFVFTATNTYTFQETGAPEGYKLQNQVYTWRPEGEAASLVAAGGIKWIGFENYPNTHRIVIAKYADDTGAVLPDAVFALLHPDATPVFRSGGTEVVFTTDSAGRIEIEGLDPGTYYLQEIEAPEGYTTPEGFWKIVIEGDEPISADPKHYDDIIDDGENEIFETIQTDGDVFMRIDNVRDEIPHRFSFPLTGGSGLLMSVIIGCLLIAGAAVTSRLSKGKGTSTLMLLMMVGALVLVSVPLATAQIVLDPAATGTLYIHKYLMGDVNEAGVANDGREVSSLPADATPLSDIAFRIQKVIPDKTGTGSALAFLEGERWIAVGGVDFTVTTDVGGVASASGLANGYYLVSELASEMVAEPASPFLVSMPTFIPQTGAAPEQLYEVHAYPKNMNITINKVIEYLDGSTGEDISTCIGENTTWLISAGIPSHISSAQSFAITDTFGTGLRFVESSTEVWALSKIGETISLVENIHYTISATPVSTGGGGTVTIDFTPTGLAALSGNTQISVRLQTELLPSAAIATSLVNHAGLAYVNAVGDQIVRQSDPDPEVHTGGVRILKQDVKSGVVLAGAQFKLVEKISNRLDKDLEANGYVQRDGADYIVTTDKDGQAEIIGLAYGDKTDTASGYTDYWLVEIKAPAGYKLPANPVEIRVDANSFEAGFYKYRITNEPTVLNKIGVIDPAKPAQPGTAKTGDTLRVLIPLLAVFAAMVILIKRYEINKRRAKLLGGDVWRQ